MYIRNILTKQSRARWNSMEQSKVKQSRAEFLLTNIFGEQQQQIQETNTYRNSHISRTSISSNKRAVCFCRNSWLLTNFLWEGAAATNPSNKHEQIQATKTYNSNRNLRPDKDTSLEQTFRRTHRRWENQLTQQTEQQISTRTWNQETKTTNQDLITA